MTSDRPLTHTVPVDEELTCAYCGTAKPLTPSPATLRRPGWIDVDVTRRASAPGDARVDQLSLAFCCPDHAGRYFFKGKLPSPQFQVARPSWTMRERARSGLAGLAIAGVPVLSFIGLVSIVQWVIN